MTPSAVTNVIAEIRGTTTPTEKVIVGGHSDAWTYGANDNVAATRRCRRSAARSVSC